MNEAHTKALSDAIYVDKVKRARTLSVGERLDTAIELFEGGLGLMRDGIRAQFPQASPEEIEALLQKRFHRIRQLESYQLAQAISA